jgi:DNA-binding beta-propeller fold protein YncE
MDHRQTVSFVLAILMIVGAAHAGQLFVINMANDTIQTVMDDGTGLETLVSGQGNIMGLALDARNGHIYWVHYATGRIDRADLDGCNITPILETGMTNEVLQIEVNPELEKLYWTAVDSGRIQSANLDGSGFTNLITGLYMPDGLYVDDIGGHIYFTEQFGQRVARANLDGSNVTTLLYTTSNTGSYSVICDPTSGWMYWSEGNSRLIGRAAMDGTNPITLISTPERPFGLALDPGKDFLYWTNLDGHQIRRANLDGTNVTTLVTGLSQPREMEWMDTPYYEGGFDDGGFGDWIVVN